MGARSQRMCLQAVLERERQFLTGIGYWRRTFPPRRKRPPLSNLVAVAGTARTPCPMKRWTGEPVRLFFLLAGPESRAGAHVNAPESYFRGSVRRASNPARRRRCAISGRDSIASCATLRWEEQHRRQCDTDNPANSSLRCALRQDHVGQRVRLGAGSTGAATSEASSSSTCAIAMGSSRSRGRARMVIARKSSAAHRPSARRPSSSSRAKSSLGHRRCATPIWPPAMSKCTPTALRGRRAGRDAGDSGRARQGRGAARPRSCGSSTAT